MPLLFLLLVPICGFGPSVLLSLFSLHATNSLLGLMLGLHVMVIMLAPPFLTHAANPKNL